MLPVLNPPRGDNQILLERLRRAGQGGEPAHALQLDAAAAVGHHALGGEPIVGQRLKLLEIVFPRPQAGLGAAGLVDPARAESRRTRSPAQRTGP